MRALVIAPQPFFTPRGTPFSVYHRTRVTAELGIAVDLLTYGVGADVDLPGVRIVRIPRIRFLEPIKVGPSIAKLLLDVLMVIWTVALLARRRYDFVHAHEEAVFFCVALKPLFGFKLVYDMHSSLPQQLTSFEFTRSTFLIGVFERLELAALTSSEAVITISPLLAEYALAHLSAPETHVLIENSLFDPIRLTDGAPEIGSEHEVDLPAGRPIVAYAGTLEAYQGIGLLLESQALLLRRGEDPFLLVVGGSERQVAQYREQAESLGIADDCLFTGVLPQERARALVRRSSVVVSPRTKGVNTPLKIYELLASGIPLVATRITSHTQVLDDHVCFLADPDPASFSAAVLEALTDDPRRERTVAGAIALYESRYSRTAYVDKMQRVLDRLA
jgi:glycosyltransferase involved in cell wall biosynthesis